MYQVYCDSYLLHDDRLESLRIFQPKLEMELNKSGSFTFTIYPEHSHFNVIQRLKSIIRIYQDGFLLFRGRVLDDEEGFHNERQVSCEGELAFLLDSIQRPFDFSGTITEFLTMLLASHNSQVEEEKQFILGNVTVTDPNNTIARSDTEYQNTFETIQKGLLDTHGGYLWIRHEENGNFLDYVADFNMLATQKIEFAKNLIDLKRQNSVDDVCTVLVPLGKDGMTIESVNNGVDFVENTDAISQYGRIVKVNKWDDVEVPENLLTKANAYLQEHANGIRTLDITSADLATIEDVNSFRLGTKVRVTTKPHSIDQNFLITKLSINLLNPADNKLILGSTESLIEEQIDRWKKSEGEIVRIHQSENGISGSILELRESLTSMISQTQDEILLQVSESYYLADDADELISAINTKFTQTATEFELQFNQFSQDIADVATGADAHFEEITKYIRFVDGNIILGEDGNELILQIENDRISFRDNGIEVAYFSNNKLFVTDGEFLNTLTLGNFAFIPRSNGNLSLKKV